MTTQVTGSYEDMCRWDNLSAAYREATKGKRSTASAASFGASFVHLCYTNRPTPCRSHSWGGAIFLVATFSCCQHSGTRFRD